MEWGPSFLESFPALLLEMKFWRFLFSLPFVLRDRLDFGSPSLCLIIVVSTIILAFHICSHCFSVKIFFYFRCSWLFLCEFNGTWGSDLIVAFFFNFLTQFMHLYWWFACWIFILKVLPKGLRLLILAVQVAKKFLFLVAQLIVASESVSFFFFVSLAFVQ